MKETLVPRLATTTYTDRIIYNDRFHSRALTSVRDKAVEADRSRSALRHPIIITAISFCPRSITHTLFHDRFLCIIQGHGTWTSSQHLNRFRWETRYPRPLVSNVVDKFVQRHPGSIEKLHRFLVEDGRDCFEQGCSSCIRMDKSK